MKKYFLGLILILVIAALLLFQGPSGKTILVGGKKIKLIGVAKTEAQKEQGLSDRKSLCSDCGLLFIFGQPGIYPFWMRRMYFDIDILWISGDRVVDITYGAKKPSPEEFDNPKAIYTPKSPVDKVLEVNSGWVRENEIKVGDSFSLID